MELMDFPDAYEMILYAGSWQDWHPRGVELEHQVHHKHMRCHSDVLPPNHQCIQLYTIVELVEYAVYSC